MLEGVYQNFVYPSHVNPPPPSQAHPQGQPQPQPAPSSPSSPTLAYTPETHLQAHPQNAQRPHLPMAPPPAQQHPHPHPHQHQHQHPHAHQPQQSHHHQTFGGYRDAMTNYRGGYYPVYSPVTTHHASTTPTAASVYSDHSHYGKPAESGQYPFAWSGRPPSGGGDYGSSWTTSPPSRPLPAGVNYIGGPGVQPASNTGNHPALFEPGPSAAIAPRPKLTTTVWEDENTVCYQVDAKGVCVARRADNSMINGTKLLNVVGMSRGKRDGILKSEKGRVVVKVGAMHLKGVWIPMKRAQALATKFGILDLLYPLFEQDPSRFAYSMPQPLPMDPLREGGLDKRLRPSSWSQVLADQGAPHATPLPSGHTSSAVGPSPATRPPETESDEVADCTSPTSPTGTHNSSGVRTQLPFHPGNSNRGSSTNNNSSGGGGGGGYMGLNYYYHHYDYHHGTSPNDGPRPASPYHKLRESEKRKRHDEPVGPGDHPESNLSCSPALTEQSAKRVSLSGDHSAPFYVRGSASYSLGNTSITPSPCSNDRDKRVH